jgi:hypothetical protein
MHGFDGNSLLLTYVLSLAESAVTCHSFVAAAWDGAEGIGSAAATDVQQHYHASASGQRVRSCDTQWCSSGLCCNPRQILYMLNFATVTVTVTCLDGLFVEPARKQEVEWCSCECVRVLHLTGNTSSCWLPHHVHVPLMLLCRRHA